MSADDDAPPPHEYVYRRGVGWVRGPVTIHRRKWTGSPMMQATPGASVLTGREVGGRRQHWPDDLAALAGASTAATYVVLTPTHVEWSDAGEYWVVCQQGRFALVAGNLR